MSDQIIKLEGPRLLPNVTYPFWGVNKPNYCGQTEFQLTCKNNQNLTLVLTNLSLQVISFDLENQTLTVVDESLFEGRCPSMSLNFTGANQFTIAPTVEKIDLFICPASQMVSPLSAFTCRKSNGEIVTYYAFKPSDSVTDCVKMGEYPVLSSLLDEFQRSRLKLKEALVKGFDLRFNIRDDQSCRGCSNSHGVCGSEPVSGSFQCLCYDKLIRLMYQEECE
ncbi:wall-associated receptor kinase carboxy-terminal protein [Arabidopsis thaliana]|uniref:non-specific serine/threonine protein kinase n=1 Tax=Arabidopsis thaliana TaxID=3702 RepID=F4HQ34_ARATH|nr:wall-associated receptor kinase carboxy-terminal protein [Arabidopsis thaliana]AEE34584.1 wall-associated receptor kinase carboxy-terminal protein [Arabidopsis thaliana]|eukprot:NP_683477.1 wall-associated receptor kinase carboxy-terminal protein [Arabidopsis thaliana]